MNAMLLVLLSFLDGNATPALPADLVEVNHCYDAAGNHRFDQLLVWKWSPDYRRFDVVAWSIPDTLLHGKTVGISGKWYRPTMKRETWSVGDPETANRALFPISGR